MQKKYQWDSEKNRTNQTKHGISFEDAKEVFEDNDRIQYITYRGYERRWKTVGSILGVLFSVVYTMRKTVFRIISARRANKKEKRDYSHNKSKKQA
ncbi:MAG: BrnT family toxin [Bacteroidota bacterium]